MIDLIWKTAMTVLLAITITLTANSHYKSAQTATEVHKLKEQMASFIPPAYQSDVCKRCHRGMRIPEIDLKRELVGR